MSDRSPLHQLVGLGTALLALTACGLLLDLPTSTGTTRVLRLDVLMGLLTASRATATWMRS